MHNLFLGELRHHCRSVWGLEIKDKGGDGGKVTPHSPEEQRTNLQRVLKGLTKQSGTALRKVRKGYLVAVAEVNGVASFPSTLLTKDAYIQGLLIWMQNHTGPIKLPPVLEEDVVDFHVAQGPHDISKFRVLDQATIERIRADIAATVFPSWMERPPRNFGSPSHGKLKADQWRTVCTVSLVITLCRLWGTSSASQKEKLLLDNFVHLVSAVDLATRRTTDPDRIARFDAHIVQYLSSLQSLFAHDFVPNHHLSLHLHECLLLFGPVHAWWAFPFERYNGLLQRLNNNNKTRDMPLTFMSYFYVGAQLRWLMDTTQWPDTPEYKAMLSAYDDAFTNIAQGMRASGFGPPGRETSAPSGCSYDERKEKSLGRHAYEGLLSVLALGGEHFSSMHARYRRDVRPILNDLVNYIPSLHRDHMTLATRSSAFRDSFVMFTDPLRPSADPRAGQIVDIFLHSRLKAGKPVVEPFLIVEEFVELTADDASQDPYRRFSDLQTRLCYNRAEPTPRVVRLDDIHCHFAALTCKVNGISEECIIVRSLNRVSPARNKAINTVDSTIPPGLIIQSRQARWCERYVIPTHLFTAHFVHGCASYALATICDYPRPLTPPLTYCSTLYFRLRSRSRFFAPRGFV
ncbi:hypothetical protein C8Q73DRAFT_644239 [Cubamyces lactineus]|nr:hypothetical protein C8Q73DRAFT_644239 [Cubamyces lactineus]